MDMALSLLKMVCLLSLFCWPSVTVKSGQQVLVCRRVVKAESSDTFAGLLEKVDMTCAVRSISCVVVSKSEHLSDLVHEVPLDAPVLLCEQHGSNVCYHLEHNIASSLAGGSGRYVFDVLMGSCHKRLQPNKVSGTQNLCIFEYTLYISHTIINHHRRCDFLSLSFYLYNRRGTTGRPATVKWCD